MRATNRARNLPERTPIFRHFCAVHRVLPQSTYERLPDIRRALRIPETHGFEVVTTALLARSTSTTKASTPESPRSRLAVAPVTLFARAAASNDLRNPLSARRLARSRLGGDAACPAVQVEAESEPT